MMSRSKAKEIFIMATRTDNRAKAEERAALQGTKSNSFKDVGLGAVRPLELNNINEGETVTIPRDYSIFAMPMNGTTSKAVKVVTEEGKDFWVGCLTRGAKPANGGDYVRPSGTVVEAVQKHASMDEAFAQELAGKKIKFTKKTIVASEFNGEARNVNVWQLDFA